MTSPAGEEVERLPADLAPGDARAEAFDWAGLRVVRVRSPGSGRGRAAFERLWAEFGPRHEMERREVVTSRLGWDPACPVAGLHLRYEILVVERESRIVAVRDHTAIAPESRPGAPVVVHLSHVVVDPELRGGGLASWLRALPLQTARECAAASGSPRRPIVLVAEMEPPCPGDAAVERRLRSYERAGFRKLDPARVRYAQPDFRAPDEIDASGVRPVPLALLVRRVGREAETAVAGREVREIVSALYSMFALHQRPGDMAPLWRLFDRLPREDEPVALQEPTR